jgi:hypothetical protein
MIKNAEIAVRCYQKNIRFAKKILAKYQPSGVWEIVPFDILKINRIRTLVEKIQRRALEKVVALDFELATWQMLPAVYNGCNGFEFNGRFRGVTLLDGPDPGEYKVFHE